MQSDELPTMAYHFAKYINDYSADDFVILAAAILSWQNAQGHVCIDLQDYTDTILFAGDDFTGIATPSLNKWLAALHKHPWVSDHFPAPLILEDTRLYLGKYWRFETQLADAIKNRLSPNTKLNSPLLKSGLQRLFPKVDNTVDWQAVAAAIALLNRFVVISGGPGTGKTSTVIRILALLLAQNPAMKIELIAPTGKAAARLAESIRNGKQDKRLSALTDEEKTLIPESAKTIHRLLKYSPRGFYHNAENLIPVDTLVVDEASMVDLPLMARLLTAIPADTHVILLGDRDQLASVEAGSVLGDITGHGHNIIYPGNFINELEQLGVIQQGDIDKNNITPPLITRSIALLHKSYRFDETSGIGTAASFINKGNGGAALRNVLLNPKFPDTEWISVGNDTLNPDCITWASNNYSNYLSKNNIKEALELFEKSRILTALRNGEFGMDELNKKISHRLLQNHNLVQHGDEFHGKPIMITRNDYELDLFNGDIGLIWWSEESKQFNAHFPSSNGEVRTLSTRQLPQHETAFAMTIHKSQGSEFDNLLLILPPKATPVVSKELIYTGITRAKKQVLVAGNEAIFVQACKESVKRSSGLDKKLGW